MRQWVLALGLTLAGPFLISGSANADGAASGAAPMQVMFMGYQMLNGQPLIQLHVFKLAPRDQPPLAKTGDNVSLGPLGIFTVGAFHQKSNTVFDPTTGKPIQVDASTVELIDAMGHKTILQFRGATEVKPSSARLTQTRSPRALRSAA